MAPRGYLIRSREPAITRGWTPYSSDGVRRQRQHRRATTAGTLTAFVSILCLLTLSASSPDMHAGSTRGLQSSAAVKASAGDRPAVDAERVERPAVSGRTGAPAPGARRTRTLRAYTKEEVQALIRAHARAHGIDPQLPLAIAECESGFRWNAANGRSSARGVFQYLSGTWRSTDEGRNGASVLDAEANIRMAVSTIARSGPTPWAASQRCWGDGGVRS
jgi:hypothetical protein